MIDELFLCEFFVPKVADEHAFRLIGNAAFEANIGSGQRVVSSDHDHADLSLFQLLYSAFCLWL